MRSAVALLLVTALGLAACSAAVGDGVAGTPAGSEAWRTTPLRDVVTGDEFRITDLQGKVVAIEAMAIWCVNCRLQQQQAQAALAAVGSPDVVYVSVDVDPNERDGDLADYARQQGFGWRFVVASADVSRSLAATFGDQILSPPATPLVVLGPDGRIVEQHIGIKGAADLESLLKEHLP